MALRTALAIVVAAYLTLASGCFRPLSGPGTTRHPPPTPYTLRYPPWAVDSMHFPIAPYDNPLTVEGIALGRRLFYEPALSRDHDLSCGSCHLQAHAFSDPERYSQGIEGQQGARNAMALVNLAWNHFFFWDARALTLELQAFEPVRDHRELFNSWPEIIHRLRERPGYDALFQAAFGTLEFDSLHVVYALAQFERTLISFDSPFDRFHYGCDSTALTPAQRRGQELFFGKAHCSDCHELPLFQDHTVANIGLDPRPVDLGMGGYTGRPEHNGRFKTPTLRNIAASAPYMHDGRFATLREVVDFYADRVHVDAPNFDDHLFAWKLGLVKLDGGERDDLVRFLEALTDSSFLLAPEFGPPGK